MRALRVFVAMFVAGCHPCPALEYFPQLTVSVSDEAGASVGDFTLTLTPATSAASGPVTCPQAPACGPAGATVPVMPGELQLDVVAGARRATFGITPCYQHNEGPDGCGVADTGSIDVTVH